MIRNWFLRRYTSQTRPRDARRSHRLRVECLEDRVTPATFNVTTAADVVSGTDGKRSLREAINQANALLGADVIVLPAGVFKIALDGANENLNATGDFDVTDAVTIRGAGAGLTVIDAQRKDRLFDVIGPLAGRFVDVTLRGGGGMNNGGAVHALDADLTIRRCVVADNQLLVGGGIYAENGDVTVTDSTIARNVSQGNGGGIRLGQGTLTMSGSTVRFNIAGLGGGGVLTNNATLTACTFTGNSAGDSGGGVFAFDTVELRDCTVSGNSSGSSGGGIRAFTSATLTRTTVSGNRASQDGGGISLSTTIIFGDAILNRCTVSGNSSGTNGGGINTSFATLTGTTISGNTAVSFGGGINTIVATLTRSTISSNSAGASGGGMLANSATLTNCTISSNSAGTNGGGIFASEAIVNNCTVVNNLAQTGGGGIFHEPTSTITIRNTIVALNLVGFDGTGPDVSGVFASQGSNLIGDVAGSTGFNLPSDIVGSSTSPLNPRLGPLAANGGPTRTHSLLAGSPAIDRGNVDLLPPTDQRGAGFLRVKDGDGNGVARVDIGAYER